MREEEGNNAIKCEGEANTEGMKEKKKEEEQEEEEEKRKGGMRKTDVRIES